jgi:hypothetical protein
LPYAHTRVERTFPKDRTSLSDPRDAHAIAQDFNFFLHLFEHDLAWGVVSCFAADDRIEKLSHDRRIVRLYGQAAN